ncbi:hypothetical protein [Candidatus Viridilinea mediisalina]|uniref:CopG family transcriptional regulator n=1 Tax=Candidatus Viridilinea mediisalina TaxID=2024553 RepID=A0A2A6RIV0_9CHLR|nr:hypothetical protein [Candidatus Viridilinea mediisalina]PDW02873.1 hypothetical protein CJ255_11750 [Candidatus Viridilinea mediisalina]
MLQINISDALYESLLRTAQQANQPLDIFIATLLKTVAEEAAHDPIEAWIGAFPSNHANWADQHDRILGENSMVLQKENHED